MNISVLSSFDWFVIAIYVGATLGIAVWSKISSGKTSEEYLIAGRSMNWFVVAIAVFATLFSTISFVAVPGEAYSNGIFMLLVSVCNLFFVPLGVILFLRFFFLSPVFTAYEYLEKRYCRTCRIIGSLLFLTIRLIYAGCVFYSAAIIFQSLVGWPPMTTIIVIGVLTVAYTVTGGIKAVIFADVVQSIIIFGGIGVILLKLLHMTGFNIGDIWSFAGENDHTFGILRQKEFYQFDFHSRLCIWSLLPIIITTPLISLSCDQLVIQRLLTGKGYKGAVKSVYTNYAISIPVMAALYLIGIILYYYYKKGGGQLPAEINGDQVLGYFINTQLPSPLPGIIIAALLSALMSTIAGVVNSAATVFYKDIMVLLLPSLDGSGSELKWCYWLSVIGGITSLIVASFLTFAAEGVKSNMLEIIYVWESLWGILFIAFLYGVLSTRVSAKAILVTMITCGVFQLIFSYLMYYCVSPDARWGFSWIKISGLACAFVLPPILSFIWPNKKDLANLTIWTLKKHPPMENREKETL